MKENPLVSVIIPSYNSSQYLFQCLDAIKSSEYTNYKIIVVDDASIDKSPEIARQTRTRLIQMDKQSGPEAARNTGVQRAYRYYLPCYSPGESHYCISHHVALATP